MTCHTTDFTCRTKDYVIINTVLICKLTLAERKIIKFIILGDIPYSSRKDRCVRFQVIIVLTTKSTVFWDLMPCNLVEGNITVSHLNR
jgi:hypothetical protein